MSDDPIEQRPSPHYDAEFGKLCRDLMRNGLVMHTPARGAPYIAKRNPKKALHPFERKRREDEAK